MYERRHAHALSPRHCYPYGHNIDAGGNAGGDARAIARRRVSAGARRHPADASGSGGALGRDRGQPAGVRGRQPASSPAGSANMQELYALAAEIFRELASTSGGDTGKMSQALSRGTNDPVGFAATLSPATLQRLRELSVKISDRPR